MESTKSQLTRRSFLAGSDSSSWMNTITQAVEDRTAQPNEKLHVRVMCNNNNNKHYNDKNYNKK